jgi:hypothetical protein
MGADAERRIRCRAATVWLPDEKNADQNAKTRLLNFLWYSILITDLKNQKRRLIAA